MRTKSRPITADLHHHPPENTMLHIILIGAALSFERPESLACQNSASAEPDRASRPADFWRLRHVAA
jgi:hypothetical protein